MKQLLCAALAVTSVTFAAERKLGQPLTLAQPVTLADLFAKPDPLVGQTVQVKGRVTEVCEAMGCWMDLADDAGHLLHIEVPDGGEIVFPKDAIGRSALVEGKLSRIEMSREQVVAQAKEEARENHRKFNAAKIRSGKTVYQIAGSGAVILD